MRLDDAAREKAKTKFFVEGSQKVIEFIDALQKNSIYQSAAPDKSTLRDELAKMNQLCRAATSDSPVSITDLDSLKLRRQHSQSPNLLSMPG